MKNIPTNVITGFLGVGKSTAIMNLLQHKPAEERWAVLVNEFGEVGVDGSLMQGLPEDSGGVFIREVAGGCMCCAAGVPMQIALTALLARAKPQRLLIEPTGLGHPREVLSVLSAEHYKAVLDLQATITLVDARKIQEARYTGNAIFNEQLAVADIIVANKTDLYAPDSFSTLLTYLEQHAGLNGRTVYQTRFGALQPDWLSAPAKRLENARADEQESLPANSEVTPVRGLDWSFSLPLPACGYRSVENQGEGYFSRGWIFRSDRVFDADKLKLLLTGLDAVRVKAVAITTQGVMAYNKADAVLTERMLDDCLDSRIECISDERPALEPLESALLACLSDSTSMSAG